MTGHTHQPSEAERIRVVCNNVHLHFFLPRISVVLVLNSCWMGEIVFNGYHFTHTYTHIENLKSSTVFLFFMLCSCPPSQQISLLKPLCSSHTQEINLSCRQESIFFSLQVPLLPGPPSPYSHPTPSPTHHHLSTTVHPPPRPLIPHPSAAESALSPHCMDNRLTTTEKTQHNPLKRHTPPHMLAHIALHTQTHNCHHVLEKFTVSEQ